MRGQASVEYLTLTAFLLIVVAAGFAYSFVSYNDALRLTQLDLATKQIRAAVDQVQLEGRGSARVVDIVLPGTLTVNVLHICNPDLFEQIPGGLQTDSTNMDYCRVHENEDCDTGVRCSRAPFALYSILRLTTLDNDMVGEVTTAGILDEAVFEEPEFFPAEQGSYRLKFYGESYAPNNTVVIRVKKVGG